MKVFIGSSRERRDLMGKVAYWLEDEGCLPQRWDEPGLFMPGEYVFQSLLQIANSVDAAILIFGDDDKLWYRGGLLNSPRDNVLLEYGLFAGLLSPKRAIVCRVGDTKMPTDIDRIVSVNVTEDTFERARLELRTWVARLKSGLEMVGLSRPAPVRAHGSSQRRQDQTIQLVNHDPRLVVASDPSSISHVSADFLREPIGGMSLWLDLPPFGEGIRHLVNNRYIIAHATNEGNIPYENVVALARGPRIYDPPTEPRWKLWLANKDAQRFERAIEDTDDIEPGWHHFVVRWNHNVPLIELVIDRVPVVSTDEYLSYWPTQYAETVLFGTWPHRWSEFYLNGRIARTQVLRCWPSDGWIQNESQNRPVNITE